MPQSMLESVKGIVNRWPKVTPSQCSESGITLSRRLPSGECVRSQIFVAHGDHLAHDSSGPLFCFYGSLSLCDSSFPPPRGRASTHSPSHLRSQSYPIHLSVMAKPGDAHWVAASVCASTISSAWAWSSGIQMLQSCALRLGLSSLTALIQVGNSCITLHCGFSILLPCLCANGSCTSI